MSNGSGSMDVDFGPTRPVVLWRWLPITEGEVGLACIRCFAPTQPYVAREPSARPGCVRMTADEAGKAPLPSLRHLFRSLLGRLRHASGFPVTGDQQAALALLLPLLALLLSLGSWAPSAFAAPVTATSVAATFPAAALSTATLAALSTLSTTASA